MPALINPISTKSLTLSIGWVLATTTANLKAADIKTAGLDSLILLAHASGRTRAWLLSHPEYRIHESQFKQFGSLVERRTKHEPIAYIIGHKEFYGLDFKVNPDVLIPRPDTEALVELALELQIKSARVLDIGTGSGAIAIAIAKHRPHWQITASDISPAALKIARYNAKKHGVKIDFVRSDLFSAWQGPTLPTQFDLIIANLPYLKDSQLKQPALSYEPALALRAGLDGLELYRRFLSQLPAHLSPDGQVLIEAEPRQHRALLGMARATGFKKTAVKDFAMALAKTRG